MFVVEESAEAYTLRGAELELSFRRVGDRWQHSVSIRRDGESSPVVVSDEGMPTDKEIPSPALQDLRLEKLGDDVFEFQMLGQAAKVIYSAAVRFDGAAQTIDFDLCARGRSVESPLCTESRYRLADGHETATVRQFETAVRVFPHGVPGVEIAPLALADQPDTECRVISDGIVPQIAAGCFGITGSDSSKKGISVRWRYQISLAGDP
jgi:hypothetical protein